MARDAAQANGETTRAPSLPDNNPPGADYLLTPREAAAVLRCTPSTMGRMRRDGDGPDWTEVRGRPRYWHSALVAYLARGAHSGGEPFRRMQAPRRRVVNVPPKRGGSKPRIPPADEPTPTTTTTEA